MSLLAAVALAAAAATYRTDCASCHGAIGQGSALAPPLIGVSATKVHFMLDTGRMPAVVPHQEQPHAPARLNADQIDALAQYVAGFSKRPDTQLPLVIPGDAGRGAELFRSNCAACHGASGSGGAVGGGAFPVAPSLAHATVFEVAEAIRTGPGAMPRFGTAVLSDADVGDIERYVNDTQTAPQPGGLKLDGIGPTAEGFVAIVFGLGLVLLLARALNPPR